MCKSLTSLYHFFHRAIQYMVSNPRGENMSKHFDPMRFSNHRLYVVVDKIYFHLHCVRYEEWV